MSRHMTWMALFSLFALGATAPKCEAASAREIDASVNETFGRFFDKVGGARDLASKATGILVFPSVVKAGIGVGGEYGEGALQIRGGTVGYYNTVSASFGFQLGVQERSVIIIFMTDSGGGIRSIIVALLILHEKIFRIHDFSNRTRFYQTSG